MNISPRTRAKRLIGAVAACYALALCLTPVALAGPIDAAGGLSDATGTVTETVGNTTGGAVDAVTQPPAGTSDAGSGPVGKVVDTVTDTTGTATGTVVETVDTVTDTVDKATGGTTKPISDATKDTVKTVGQLGTSAGDSVAGVADAVEGTIRPSGNGGSDARDNDGRARSPRSARQGPADVLGTRNEQAVRSTQESRRVSLTSDTTSPIVTAPEESLVSQIGRIASEAAKQMAFPLALTLLVIGFLTMQNRMDRKDPKLALAPVDSEHDLLSFS